MGQARVTVTFSAPPEVRAAIEDVLAPTATLTDLPQVAEADRAGALSGADAVFAWALGSELRPEEFGLLASVELVQLLSAGADHVPFDRLPAGVAVAANAGAYADPMAEHVLAMALALAKRLPQNQAALARGEFDQETPSQAIRGALVVVLGFGGIGQACARLFRALGARVQAVNRSGRTDEPVDAVTSVAELDSALSAADVLVISLPLTRATRGLIGARELALMPPHAILVNVARAAIIDEDALYDHLSRVPSFSAGIDTWWQEPRHGGTFVTGRPFLELPNVLGSPHNSGITRGSLPEAARRAALNIARHLQGEPAQHLVDRAEYLD